MKKYLEDPREELKRADHLLYVSLKYTRTVDVIKSIIDRLISTLDLTLDGLLEYAKEEKIINEVPTNVGIKAGQAKKSFDDETIHEMCNFFLYLRKISRAEYKRAREYRRHVTMTAITDEGIIDINMDIIKEHYDRTRKYVEYVETLIFGKEE